MPEEPPGAFTGDPFAALPDPAVVYGASGDRSVIRATNEAFGRTFDADVSPGDPVADLPGAASFADDLGAATTVTVEVGDERRSFRVRASTPDGPTEGDEGAGVLVYGEVTEMQRRLERVRTQRDRLDEFAGTLAHDLRNPLEVASVRTELALELGEEEHLERVEGALERMDEVITELLALAREGAAVGETEPVSLTASAEDAWETVPTGEATLSVVDEVTATADPTRLRECLENLFHNAVAHGGAAGGDDATKAGGDHVAVRVGAITEGGRIVGFYVADDGVGIAPDERSDVFDPGFSTAEGGTGFGLTVVDRIVAGHGWTVSVAESAAGGARFEVVDPAETAFSSG